MSHATATILNWNMGALNPSGHPWAERRGNVFDVFADWRPSIMTVQECWATMRADMKTHLDGVTWQSGQGWDWVNFDTVGVWWDTGRWTLLDERYLLMDSGDQLDRRLQMARLQSTATGLDLWVGSFHLTPGLDDDTIELRQTMATKMAAFLRDLWHPWVAIGGDLNEDFLPPKPGVRSILQDAGLIDTRARLGTDTVGDTVSTFNYWGDTKNEGRWIDDIFTTLHAVPQWARLVRADTIAYPNNPPSDHNAILSKVRYG